jgi:hypothetical protein
MVIPVGLLGAQQLVLAEKDLNGRVAAKEIMPVLFSLLEGSEQPGIPGVLIKRSPGLSSVWNYAADRERSPTISAVEGKADVTRASANVRS